MVASKKYIWMDRSHHPYIYMEKLNSPVWLVKEMDGGWRVIKGEHNP